MRLMHLANFNSTNVGNGALVEGTERLLEEDLPAGIQWTREPWDDYTFGRRAFDESFVRSVNAHDGLIVNGAVSINGRRYLERTGTRFDLPEPLWSSITRPVVFYGISYRHWKGQPMFHVDRLRRFMSFVLEHPRMLLGLRNDGTFEWLSELCGGLPRSRVEIVPDLGMFTTSAPRTKDGRLLPEVMNVIVAPNGEDSVYRYASTVGRYTAGVAERLSRTSSPPRFWSRVNGAARRRRQVVSALAEAIERLAEDHGASILLVPHYLDDIAMIGEITAMLPPRVAHQHVLTTGMARVREARTFYGLYASADLSISMRIHAMSPSIGLGTPTVPLVTQDRMWAFLRDAGLEDLAHDPFASSGPERLLSSLSSTIEDADRIRRRFLSVRERFRSRIREINMRIDALLRT